MTPASISTRETPRQLVPFGKPSEHDVQHVSQGFSPYYFHGYRIGLASAEDSTSSTVAWLRWLDTLTAADPPASRPISFYVRSADSPTACTAHRTPR